MMEIKLQMTVVQGVAKSNMDGAAQVLLVNASNAEI